MNEILGPVDINGHVGRTHNYCNAKWLNCGIRTNFKIHAFKTLKTYAKMNI